MKAVKENQQTISKPTTLDPLNLLLEASKDGALEEVKQLLAEDINLNSQDNKGYTALMYAAGEGNTAVVELLLEKGAATSIQEKTVMQR